MKVYPNIFSNNPVDRVSYLRSNPEWVNNTMVDSNSLFVPFLKGQPFVSSIKGLTSKNAQKDQLNPAWFPYNFFEKNIVDNSTIIFLGLLNDKSYFAIDLSKISNPEDQVNINDMGSFEDLMALSSQPIDSGELAMLGQAKAIFEWHKSHQFCSKCGQKSNMVEGGYKRICGSCNAEHFPRTDPVVIMLATHNDHAFLGRQKRFPVGMYSALAGFIEPGESIEEAVARELHEEAGIIINNATYHSSQPWAFPNSLMIGCMAESASEKFKLDEIEIDEGRWFSRDELRKAINGDENSKFFVPPKMAIAHHLIKAFVDNK